MNSRVPEYGQRLIQYKPSFEQFLFIAEHPEYNKNADYSPYLARNYDESKYTLPRVTSETTLNQKRGIDSRKSSIEGIRSSRVVGEQNSYQALESVQESGYESKFNKNYQSSQNLLNQRNLSQNSFKTPLVQSGKMMLMMKQSQDSESMQKQGVKSNIFNPIFDQKVTYTPIKVNFKFKEQSAQTEGSLQNTARRFPPTKQEQLIQSQIQAQGQVSFVDLIHHSNQRKKEPSPPKIVAEVSGKVGELPVMTARRQLTTWERDFIQKQKDELDQKKKEQDYKQQLNDQIQENRQRLLNQKVMQREAAIWEVQEFNKNFKFSDEVPLKDKLGRSVSPIQPQPIREPIIKTQEKLVQYNLSQKELIHIRPSNSFLEITEEQLNKREAEKLKYKQELQKQIEDVNRKRADMKMQKLIEDNEIKANVQTDQEKSKKFIDPNQRSVARTPPSPQQLKTSQRELNVQPRTPTPPLLPRQLETNKKELEVQFVNEELFQPNNSQLDKLKFLQLEIDRRNAVDKLESQKLMREILQIQEMFTSRLEDVISIESGARESYIERKIKQNGNQKNGKK